MPLLPDMSSTLIGLQVAQPCLHVGSGLSRLQASKVLLTGCACASGSDHCLACRWRILWACAWAAAGPAICFQICVQPAPPPPLQVSWLQALRGCPGLVHLLLDSNEVQAEEGEDLTAALISALPHLSRMESLDFRQADWQSAAMLTELLPRCARLRAACQRCPQVHLDTVP
jgi:hypothetical protein